MRKTYDELITKGISIIILSASIWDMNWLNWILFDQIAYLPPEFVRESFRSQRWHQVGYKMNNN